MQVHIVHFHSRCDCSLTIARGIWKVVCASSRVLWVLIFNAFILRSKEAELYWKLHRTVTLYGVPTASYRATHKRIYRVDKNSR